MRMDGENDEEEFVVVETGGDDSADGDTPEDDGADDSSDDDDGEEEDSRLADDDEDDASDDSANHQRRHRRKRKERQRQARERDARELLALREHVARLEQRLGQTENHNVQRYASDVDSRIAQAERDARLADDIINKAAAAGNLSDAFQARDLRDQAISTAEALKAEKQRLSQPQQQGVAPEVMQHAAEWQRSNPWYDARGSDDASRLVNEIDAELTAAGWDPRSRTYWEEMTDRVNQRFEQAEAPRNNRQQNGRKAPPLGNNRNHAPQTTRNEVYVTPERKQAMQEAGIWDDPVRRKRALKEYRDFDQTHSAR